MSLKDKFQQFLLRHKTGADFLLFSLSCIALLLFAGNELLSLNPAIMPVGQTVWMTVQLCTRTGIWLIFIIHFVSYGMLSGRPWTYARQHISELLVCLAWFPQIKFSLPHDFVSLETVQLIGTLANGFIAVRQALRSLQNKPLFATGLAFLFLVISCSLLLLQLEPQTYHSLFDALWYTITTTTAVGYGDFIPQSFAGRCVGIFLMLSGISLAGIFIGIVSKFIQKQLGHDEHLEVERLQKELAEEKAKNLRLLELLEKDNDLRAKLAKLLEERSAANH